MATDNSEDFLQEIDDLLSDTKVNGDVPNRKLEGNLAEGIKNFFIDEREDENGIESSTDLRWCGLSVIIAFIILNIFFILQGGGNSHCSGKEREY